MTNKMILLMVIILITTAPTIHTKAQTLNDSINLNYQNMAAQYAKKSHNQKVASKVLLGAGVLSATIGFGMAVPNFKGFFDPSAPPPKDYGSAPDILMIGGAVLIVTAIPISLAGRKNKKLARLYMNKEHVMLAPEVRTTARITSIGIKISL